jgi:hypothetical protein
MLSGKYVTCRYGFASMRGKALPCRTVLPSIEAVLDRSIE